MDTPEISKLRDRRYKYQGLIIGSWTFLIISIIMSIVFFISIEKTTINKEGFFLWISPCATIFFAILLALSISIFVITNEKMEKLSDRALDNFLHEAQRLKREIHQKDELIKQMEELTYRRQQREEQREGDV